jgi:hypothetical protein
MNKILNILLIVCAVAIAGCIETKDEITVNPDGSGKVIHEITFQPMDLGMMGDMTGAMGEMGGEMMGDMTGAMGEMGGEMMGDMTGAMGDMTGDMGEITAEMGDMTAEMTAEMGDMMSKMMGGESSDPQAQLRESVKEILTQSSGIETWKEVSYKLTDDGRTYFKGTAYFPNINNLSLHNPGPGTDMKLNFTRDISGEITIELKTEEEDGESGAVKEPISEIPEAELDKMVKEAKLEYNQGKPMMQAILATIKSETILHLPGTIKQISNFEKVDARTVRIALDGSKIMEAMDKMMQDEDLLKQQIREGKDPMQGGPGDDLAMNEMFFGERAPVRVVLAGGAQPLFDYNAEVTAAKANYENMLKELGLEEAKPVKPTIADVPPLPGFREVTTPTATERVTGEMKVKVAGVRLVKYSDFERGIMPLGQRDGYTLSLIAELSAPAIRASGGRMEKASTDTGKSLLPKDRWGRRIKFPRLSKDKKTVVFDVEMLLPDEDVEGLQELSGTLEYLTADASRAADLGMMDFKVGAKGRELAAVIRSIEKDPWQKNATVLDLKLNLRPEVLGSVEFYAQDGTKLDVSKRGYEAFGSTTTLNFSIKGKLPPKGRIVLNVFEGLKKNEISFKLTEITLTGQSLW